MLGFLKSLVSMDTDSTLSKNYSECASLIAKEAESLGFKARICDAAETGNRKPRTLPPRPNVLVKLDAGAEKTLLINAHYDIVPAGQGWKTDPFALTIKGDRAYGRGTSDDKGGIAASLYALEGAKPKVNVLLAYTCDEEVGGEFGLGFLVKEGLAKADAALILDGSPAATVASTGVVMGRLHFKGKGGHAMKPYEADNPVPKLITFLNELKSYSYVRQNSVSPYFGLNKRQLFGRFSLTTLKGSTKENAIPDEAVAGFDLRIDPEEKMESVVEEFRQYVKMAGKKTGISPELEILSAHGGHRSGGRFVEKMKSLTNTDGNYANWGGNDGHHVSGKMETVVFGATRSANSIHAPDEFVSIKELEYVKNVAKQIMEQGW